MQILNENLEWRHKLENGDIINALDDDGTWYEAIINNIFIIDNKKMVEVWFKGWSSKWNSKYEITSEKLAERYKMVPNWIKTLDLGSPIEFCNKTSVDDSLTWSSGIVSKINDNDTIEVLKFPNEEGIIIDINGPYLAEPFTHCGFNNSAPSSDDRKLFLNKMRYLVKNKLNKINELKNNEIKSKVSDDLYKFVNNPVLSDIKFIFNDDKIIFGHKIIFCSRSEYFYKMFLSNMIESNSNEIKINDISYEVFLQLIYFLYTGKAEISNDNFYDLLLISNMYCLNDLKVQVIEFLKKFIIENRDNNEVNNENIRNIIEESL